LSKLVGITAGYRDGDVFLRRSYMTAVASAGGIPVILTPETKLLPPIDCLIISGGGDVLPEHYGVYDYDKTIVGGICTERDDFELMLAKEAYNQKMPMLCICRGIQVLNVAFGGTLCLDIAGHRQTAERHDTSHTVSILPNTQLYNIFGQSSLPVNSFHHQAVNRCAALFNVSAYAKDGTVEAIEAADSRPCIGVQWHPEAITSAPLFSWLCKSF